MTIAGKLTVIGGIDPLYLNLVPTSVNPLPGTTGTLWTNNSGKLNYDNSLVAMVGDLTQLDPIAIGLQAGETGQELSAIAIGSQAGNTGQKGGAVSIGYQAGAAYQQTDSIAIGTLAGFTGQAANTIILNASGVALNGVSEQTGSFYVEPIRGATSSNVLGYDPVTSEITYYAAPAGPAGPTGGTGPAGSSSSYFPYRADNGTVPPSGHITWSNFASQTSSTYIRVNHINQSTVDVDIFLNLLQQGNQLIIQDADVSGNFQTWEVSGTPIPNSGSNYVQYPITLFSSGGSSNFPNNHAIILALITTGPAGPAGPTGATGSSSTTGSWTLAAGANTVSLTVPINGTYSIWVRGNIPNGIVAYTATVVVTNTNVPVIGTSYAWYYSAGNALELTAIPTQVIGTPNDISTDVVATTTANVFTFGITNNSGSSQVVNWGYTTF